MNVEIMLTHHYATASLNSRYPQPIIVTYLPNHFLLPSQG